MRHAALHGRTGALHATDMVQLEHFDRSIPFYMLLSDTHRSDDEGVVDPRSAAKTEVEVMAECLVPP